VNGWVLAAEKAARAEAEAANRAKDEFLAMASHELRTPLNAILGWAQLLRSGQLDASAHLRAVETIERNGRAQVQLIEDILDGSRIITGKLHLEVRPFEMNELVRAALDAVRPAAEAKQIRLEHTALAAPLRMLGDAERLQQVVWNLLSNALKFTPKGGTVAVTCTRIGDDVEIVVRDDGQGIAPDFLPHVFERFRQAEGSTTRRHGGLGLGLALVRHLTEAHGGTVRAESDGPGKGAAFYLHLPMSAVASERPSMPSRVGETDRATPTTLSAPQLQGVTALVVDDEADARDLVATVLRSKGAVVTTAAGAEEGLRLILRNPPMVLLSDIAMPEVDGYAFLAQVRTATGAAGATLPAIAITAYAREEDRRRAATAGFQAHVAKPVDPDPLIAAVANLVPAVREATTSRSPRAPRPEAFQKLTRALELHGITAALRILNARSAHRFTAVYRLDGEILRNVALVDAENAQVERGDDVPLEASYCSLVTARGNTFTTEDAAEDDRLRQHPARDVVRSYCGTVLRDAEGRPMGTLCHFDPSPCDIPVSEIPLLEALAPYVASRLLR
jgi:CheY-like chemotaxis protein/anti-sigma regulatory factor (Ser/Thr protein kinase)